MNGIDELMDKKFECNGVTVTRQHYKSLQHPMMSERIGDDVMDKIAKDTHCGLLEAGWSQDQISKYLGNGEVKWGKEAIEADHLESDFWMILEKVAVDKGMKYCDDIK